MSEPKSSIYVLQLEGEKLYVGRSSVPQERILAHFNGDGAAWTKRHRPLHVLEVREDVDRCVAWPASRVLCLALYRL